MRALECLVHEATHGNLSSSRRVNDWMAWGLGALPLLHNVQLERTTHLRHHSWFWVTGKDPEVERSRLMGIDRLPAPNGRAAAAILVRGFAPYLIGAGQAFFLPIGERLIVRSMRLGLWLLAAVFFAWSGC